MFATPWHQSRMEVCQPHLYQKPSQVPTPITAPPPLSLSQFSQPYFLLFLSSFYSFMTHVCILDTIV